MHIVLMCATKRGRMVLEKILDHYPDADLTVFSFREDPWEPPFFEEIKTITLDHGGIFKESRNVGSQLSASFWETADIDIAFAVSWRYMIPARVFNLPMIGTFVFHDSLLPAYRGFSPTVWSIINGEDHTGVTLFKIADDVDSGDILDQEKVLIGPDETIAEVMGKVTQTYISIFEKNIDQLLNRTFRLKGQDHSRASYTCKRLPQDNVINWQASSKDIYNFIRALSQPYPGAYTYLEGEKLRVWSAERIQIPAYAGRIPGRVIQLYPAEGSVVLTGDGGLLIKSAQREQGGIECAANIINRLGQTLSS